MKKYFIETFGCQMNVAESNAIEEGLKSRGWLPAGTPENADLAVVNTCSVRQSAENRIRGRLGVYKALKERKKLTLVLTGCVADRLGEKAKEEFPFVDYVVPFDRKMQIADIFGKEDTEDREGTEDGFCCSDSPGVYEFAQYHRREGEFSSYVPIMNGCDNFCSYCIVPYVRGREISREPDKILEEIALLDSEGVREVTLLGQNVNSYRYGGVDFPQLLERICPVLDNIRWIRFESPHPKDFSDRLIETVASQERIAKHLHIPMQSGNSRILNLMNRKYTAEDFCALIDKIKRRIPDITFATDMMVGFPGETEEEFEDTLSIAEKIGFIEAYMYYWNPREGTRAVKMPGQLDEKTKRLRLEKLIDFQLANALRIKQGRTGSTAKVLVLSVSRDNPGQLLGRSEHNEMVVFKPSGAENGAEIGKFADVYFRSLNGNTFTGEQV